MLNNDRGVQTLARNGRSPAQLSGGYLDVVCPERQNDIFHGQTVTDQLVGIDPDPHGILGAEICYFADARHP